MQVQLHAPSVLARLGGMEYGVIRVQTGVLTCRRWPRRRCALSDSEP